ncbi:formate/nitrite transporter family protein [Brachybacterium halotolerans subsp. kimchii]|uniref:formate/nitrite transporter family protein n=1 Tax=Brachybacterium halotolerans TaxID=2795215 RepID=UPI001E650FD8|nr:formate/nitrite transporter family protein [Brachybacterium halotolerans]UEJ84561.1 formate/nitrite transporter family protein [Brachybacterium halotolerans subsp. kimchii]
MISAPPGGSAGSATAASYVSPSVLVDRLTAAGAAKMHYSTRETVLRAVMGGAILTLGAAFAVTVSTQTGQPLLGAMLFPVGFILLYLLGYDLLTGVFTLLPLALIARRPGAAPTRMLRTWGLVFLGNFAGAFAVALLMAVYFTYGFSSVPSDVGQAIREIGHSRTVGYAEHGGAGMLTLFVRGMLCNWMVSTGVVAAFMSDSMLAKIVGMWMPVMLFFYMGFEHSVVNMFLFPSGLLLGADFTIGDYLIWNEIPTVLGNLVGGLVFVGLPLYFAHRTRRPVGGTATADEAEEGAAAEALAADSPAAGAPAMSAPGAARPAGAVAASAAR